MQNPSKIVCLDAGHGGHDPGAVNMRLGLTEADLALKVVRKIKPILEANGVKVILTRTDNTALAKLTSEDLNKRARISNQANANAFVSVHLNSAATTEAKGMEVFSYSGANTPQLAKAVHAEMQKNKTLYVKDRGLKTADFAVLRETYCIACLVEMAFISNDEDAKRVRDNIDAYAKAIARGILNYLGIKPKEEIPKPKANTINRYQADIDSLKAKGITTGERANDPITRGETFALLNRTLHYLLKKEGK